jgi:hypothetical protein
MQFRGIDHLGEDESAGADDPSHGLRPTRGIIEIDVALRRDSLTAFDRRLAREGAFYPNKPIADETDDFLVL